MVNSLQKIAHGFYTEIVYQQGHKNLEPFTFSLAAFSYEFGIQAGFIRCALIWRTAPLKKQQRVFLAFLRQIYKINTKRIKTHNYYRRMAALREVQQRLWVLYRTKQSAIKKAHFHQALKQNGLGKYFRQMQKHGWHFKIPKAHQQNIYWE